MCSIKAALKTRSLYVFCLGLSCSLFAQPIDPEMIPSFGEELETYATKKAPNAEYFRVPESVREKRNTAKALSLTNAQIKLFRFIKEKRSKEQGEQGHLYWEKQIIKEAEFLKILFFQNSFEEQTQLLESKFKENPLLKLALSYFGLLRLHALYGKLGTVERVVALPAIPLGGTSIEGQSEVKELELFTPAGQDILTAQAIERSYHSFNLSNEWEEILLNNYKRLFQIDKADFLFDSLITEKVPAEIRRIGLDLIWDLRKEILPNAAEIEGLLTQLIEEKAPYGRIYIDVFKRGAFGKSSPESLFLWRHRGEGKKYRKELLGLGLVTSGNRTDSPWSLAGEKGAPGNTPDGVWKIVGFDKYYVSTGDDDMRGLVMLSYSHGRGFSGRGFHHVFFGSNWGYCGSHGCVRVYTGAEERGLANLIWAAINPKQLNKVDYSDIGSLGTKEHFQESQSIREVLRYMRENVWVSMFSAHENGYRFLGEATFSTQIRRQYEYYETTTGVSALNSAIGLVKKSSTTEGPELLVKGRLTKKKHTGKYMIFDEETRQSFWNVDLSLSKKRN